MKRSDYLYASLLLGFLAFVVYGFLNYFGMMVGLIAFSSVFNFVVFLIKTRANVAVAKNTVAELPIDFYNTKDRSTYYKTSSETDFFTEQRKAVNAD